MAVLGWLAATRPAEAPPTPANEPGPTSHCFPQAFEGSDFTVCDYDGSRHRIALFVEENGAALRSFTRLEQMLGPRSGDLLFAMNAGMYDEQGMPIGLHVEAGIEKHAINLRDGPGNFHMKPNGVFAVAPDGTVSVVPSGEWRGREADVATQSGPMLVIAGKLHPKISPNGESLHVRNGVCVADRRRARFAISEGPVSFGRFARFFRDALGCRDALYFDGAVSSLWDKGSGRRDETHRIGPIIAVFRRP